MNKTKYIIDSDKNLVAVNTDRYNAWHGSVSDRTVAVTVKNEKEVSLFFLGEEAKKMGDDESTHVVIVSSETCEQFYRCKTKEEATNLHAQLVKQLA